MAGDYKEKLEKHIALIPPMPGMIESGNSWKPPFSEDVKKMILDPSFYTGTNPLFYKYTGTTHVALVKNWAQGGMLTTCNSFAGNCGMAMGAKDFLGQFELEKYLKKIGKADAFVPASSGEKPKYGDIFRAATFHMGVSLGFDGDNWLTVEAGQGGPKSTGYDAIKRKSQKFDPAKLIGWCNMAKYFGVEDTDSTGVSVPEWLIGNWTITGGGGETSFYHVSKSLEAIEVPFKMVGDAKPTSQLDTGKITFQGFENFTINWKFKSGFENYQYDRIASTSGVIQKIKGKNSSGIQLMGIKS